MFLSFFIFLIFKIKNIFGVQLIYNIVLISGVQKSESEKSENYLCLIFQILFPNRPLQSIE